MLIFEFKVIYDGYTNIFKNSHLNEFQINLTNFLKFGALDQFYMKTQKIW